MFRLSLVQLKNEIKFILNFINFHNMKRRTFNLSKPPFFSAVFALETGSKFHMRLGVFAFVYIIAMITSCGSASKKPHYYEPTHAYSDYSSDGNEGMPWTGGTIYFGPEPSPAQMIATYRQSKNNNAFLTIGTDLRVTFSGFSLPIIPQGQTQRLLPAFPQSLKWNSTKDLYETTGVLNRGGTQPMENVILTIVPYSSFDAIDVSLYAEVKDTDRIDSSFMVTADKSSATKCSTCEQQKPDCPTKPSCEKCCCCCEKCEDPRYGEKIFVFKFLKID